MSKLTTKHLEDFILDDSFKEFVCGTNKESVQKWHNWIHENPYAKNEFEIAIKVMNLLLKTKKEVPDPHTEEHLKELLSQIRAEKEPEIDLSNNYQWFKVAGIVTLLLTLYVTFYFLLKNRDSNAIVYNEIIVPLGEKAQLVLSDGTHIWLNSSSKLKYPVTFNASNRTVYLEGEAFFDVTKKGKTPFIVSTPDLNVKVLGTAFNVKNYPGDKKAETTVIRGLVSVERKNEQSEAILLKPHENFVLNTVAEPEVEAEKPNADKERTSVPATIKPIVNKTVNVEAITSWKDQMLVFSDEPLEEVALKMERWYNVKIYIQNEELRKERYRGKFVNNENFYQVLEAIKFTTPIKYKVKNNEIFLDKPN